MPLQTQRCHVALCGASGQVTRYLRKSLAQGMIGCGPCGQVSEEAVGAGVMVASMARAVMDLRGCTRCNLRAPRLCSLCIFLYTGDIFFTQCGRVPVCGTSSLVPSPSQCTII